MPSIIIYEIEPLFPRGSGEIDPGVKGPHAHGEPMIFPYPTALLGILTTALFDLGCIPLPNRAQEIYEWFKDFEELYTVVRGPYVKLGDDKLVLSTGCGWARLEHIYRVVGELGSLWFSGRQYSDNYLEHKRKLSEVSLTDLMEERVSIALGERKTVKEHYLTTLRMLNYRRLADKIIDKEGKNTEEVGLGVDLFIKNMERVRSCIREKKPVKAFGRDRVALLELVGEDILKEGISKLVGDEWGSQVGTKTMALYVASPLIFKRISSTGVHTLQHTYTVVYPSLDGVKEIIRSELASLCSKETSVEEVGIDGIVKPLSLGYSIKFNERKPPHNALMPGSILYVKLRECRARIADIYLKGLGLLSNLGFGTIIPIPIPT